MYRTDFWTLWEKARVGCFERTSKHVYYQGWNRSPAQVGCMRQVLRPGALGRPRGIGWRGRWKGESGWGIHVNPWLILVNVWQKPLQDCKAISLQLIKINGKKKKLNIEKKIFLRALGISSFNFLFGDVKNYFLNCSEILGEMNFNYFNGTNLVLTKANKVFKQLYALIAVLMTTTFPIFITYLQLIKWVSEKETDTLYEGEKKHLIKDLLKENGQY